MSLASRSRRRGGLRIRRLGREGIDLPSAPENLMEAGSRRNRTAADRARHPALGKRTFRGHSSCRKPVSIEIAVDFKKGCYVGQEVVSRIHSVGRVNRHLCGFVGDFDPSRVQRRNSSCALTVKSPVASRAPPIIPNCKKLSPWATSKARLRIVFLCRGRKWCLPWRGGMFSISYRFLMKILLAVIALVLATLAGGARRHRRSGGRGHANQGRQGKRFPASRHRSL